MNHTYLRGDMYYADLGRGIGSEHLSVPKKTKNGGIPTAVSSPFSYSAAE